MGKLAAILILVAGVLSAAPKKNQGIRLPDTPVRTEFGEFLIKDLAQVGRPPFRRLTGTIINNTTKTWYNPSFDFDLEGPNGAPIECTPECRVTIGGSIAPGAHVVFGQDSTSEPLGIFVVSQLTSPHELNNITLASPYFYSADYRFVMTQPVQNGTSQYEDDNFAFSVVPEYKGIKITIQNKRPTEAALDWNGAAMIGVSGESLPVVHRGLKYTDSSSVKPPTVIPPSAKIEDEVSPAASLRFENQAWGTGNWLPFAPLAATYKGKTFGLVLPLSTGGNTKLYKFVFRIDDVQ